MRSGAGQQVSTNIPFKQYAGARQMIFALGQSWIAGNSAIAGLDSQYQHQFQNVLFFRYSATNGICFSPMNWLDNPSYQAPQQSATYALQFNHYPDVASILGKDLFVVHHAQGSTSLGVDWLSTTVGGLYSQLVFKCRQAINAATLIDGVAPEAKYVLMDVGQTDASSAGLAAAYQTNALNFIDNLRTATGLSSLVFVINRLSSNLNATTFPHVGTVQTAQDNLPGLRSNVYIVNTDNVPLDGPAVHPTAPAGWAQLNTNILSVLQSNNLI